MPLAFIHICVCNVIMHQNSPMGFKPTFNVLSTVDLIDMTCDGPAFVSRVFFARIHSLGVISPPLTMLSTLELRGEDDKTTAISCSAALLQTTATTTEASRSSKVSGLNFLCQKG